MPEATLESPKKRSLTLELALKGATAARANLWLVPYEVRPSPQGVEAKEVKLIKKLATKSPYLV